LEERLPVVLGLDFGGTKIAAAVAGPDGVRLGEAVATTDPSLGGRPNFERGVSAARRLLGEVAPDARLDAVGASTFGIPEPGGVTLAPAIDGWDCLQLERELREALDCRLVRVATDVKAAAAAEVRFGALAGYDPALYVNLGTGLAVALVVDGNVVLGANGAAGEIGYSLLDRADVGKRDRVVLEEVASGMGLAAGALRRLGERVTAAAVFEREAAEPELRELVDELAVNLAYHLANLAIALNPSRIAVGGGLVRSWPRIAPVVEEALAAVPFPPELVLGAFPYDAALVGAVSLALDARADQLEAVLTGPGREQR
jgi:glucokinase